jgi:hypothetical protein
MLKVKAVTNTLTTRTVIALLRSEYSDQDIAIRISKNGQSISLVPSADTLATIVHDKQDQLLTELKSLSKQWLA